MPYTRSATCPPVRDAVEAALPIVRAHVADIEQGRRIPDRVVEALRGTGLHRMVVPGAGRAGGARGGPRRRDRRTAAVDGSTAWCSVIGAGSNLFAGYIQRRGPARVRRSRPGQRHDVGPGGPSPPTTAAAGSGDGGRSRATACTAPGSGSGRSEADDPGPRRCAGRLRAHRRRRGRGHLARGRAPGHGQSPRRRPRLAVDPARCCMFGVGPGPAGAVAHPDPVHGPAPAGGGPPRRRPRRTGRGGPPGAGGTHRPRGPLAEDPVGMAGLAAADTRLRAAAPGCAPPSGRSTTRPAAPAGPARAPGAGVPGRPGGDRRRGRGDGGRPRARRGRRRLQGQPAPPGPRGRAHRPPAPLFSRRHRGELARALAGLDVRYPPFVVDPV